VHNGQPDRSRRNPLGLHLAFCLLWQVLAQGKVPWWRKTPAEVSADYYVVWRPRMDKETRDVENQRHGSGPAAAEPDRTPDSGADRLDARAPQALQEPLQCFFAAFWLRVTRRHTANGILPVPQANGGQAFSRVFCGEVSSRRCLAAIAMDCSRRVELLRRQARQICKPVPGYSSRTLSSQHFHKAFALLASFASVPAPSYSASSTGEDHESPRKRK
jgi:hypothetical protein